MFSSCSSLQNKQNCDCFQDINFPITCNCNPTILWQTDTWNPIGTFIITACSDLKSGNKLNISVNDISGANIVATLTAGSTFAYTSDVLQSITVTCTRATGDICHVTCSLKVCYDQF